LQQRQQQQRRLPPGVALPIAVGEAILVFGILMMAVCVFVLLETTDSSLVMLPFCLCWIVFCNLPSHAASKASLVANVVCFDLPDLVVIVALVAIDAWGVARVAS
jgi:hypothetical protein